MGAGIADGSLVACYQQLEKQGAAKDWADPSLAVLLGSYFGSFGLTIFGIGVLLVVVVRCTRLLAGPAKSTSQPPSSVLSFVPGMVSGAMWAGANSCSVLASHFLGMALSFPITQTAVVYPKR